MTVLLVDDEAILRKMVKLMLQSAGCQIRNHLAVVR